jgi:hypothetical protein
MLQCELSILVWEVDDNGRDIAIRHYGKLIGLEILFATHVAFILAGVTT